MKKINRAKRGRPRRRGRLSSYKKNPWLKGETHIGYYKSLCCDSLFEIYVDTKGHKAIVCAQCGRTVMELE